MLFIRCDRINFSVAIKSAVIRAMAALTLVFSPIMLPNDLAIASDAETVGAPKSALQIGLGANLGGGSYYSGPIRESIVPHHFGSGGIDLQLVSGRFGMILATEVQTSISRDEDLTGVSPFITSLVSHITKLGLIRVLHWQAETKFHFHVGVAHAMREFRIADDTLDHQEQSTTSGGFAGIVLVHTLGDRLTLDAGASAAVLPVNIKFLDVEDTGVQSSGHVGLSLRF